MVAAGFLTGLILLSFCRATFAAGVYVDAGGNVAFLLAERSYALSGRVARSNGDNIDATLYYLDAAFPVKSWGLVELNIPFVSTMKSSTLEFGLGDLVIRARADLYRGSQRVFRVMSSLRTGTGTERVYPFSSESIDFKLGIAYVDTLEYFRVWASGGGALVEKAPESVPEDQLHGDFGQLAAGLQIPIATGLNVGAGMTALFFESGRSREIYIGTVDYWRSRWLVISFSAHVEGGDVEQRVGDTAVTGGLRVYYDRS